jgi:hypothetical protein
LTWGNSLTRCAPAPYSTSPATCRAEFVLELPRSHFAPEIESKAVGSVAHRLEVLVVDPYSNCESDPLPRFAQFA